jgi:hypothetical protein
MKLQDLDIFPKLHGEYRRQTTPSAIITLTCIALMSYLFISSFLEYFLNPPRQRLRVDESPLPTNSDSVLEPEKLPKLEIHLDIILAALPCSFVNFGVIDAFKDTHDEAFTRVKLRRLDGGNNTIPKPPPKPAVTECGSCYGAAQGCCNTCKEVKRAFKAKGRLPPPLSTIKQCQGEATEYAAIKGEKCQIYGTIVVPRTKGVVYIAPGDVYGARSSHVADYAAMGLTIDDFNLSHGVNSFFIGETDGGGQGINGAVKIQREKGRFKAMYFASAIREKTQAGEIYRTRIHHYERYREGSSGKFPGIFFFYDLAPVIVEWKRDVSFLHFLVNLMAILGGIYSLGMFLDHILNFHASEVSRNKSIA